MKENRRKKRYLSFPGASREGSTGRFRQRYIEGRASSKDTYELTNLILYTNSQQGSTGKKKDEEEEKVVGRILPKSVAYSSSCFS